MFSMSELYKIGVGPSSSHTIGPMRASHQFLGALKETGAFDRVHRVHADCHGSLALTGKGHCTDRAILAAYAQAAINVCNFHIRRLEFVRKR